MKRRFEWVLAVLCLVPLYFAILLWTYWLWVDPGTRQAMLPLPL
ncbi:MAG: hypothetical protein P8Q36_02260 [Alphaproteobacteria bacterium]|jgi:hypothetical protein|nr:hypothetical protein [Alphaproteobacteria bacterium]